MAVQKKQRRKRLVLSRGADLLLDGQMGQKGVDLRLGHLGRMADVVEMDESLDPVAIGLLGPAAVTPSAQDFYHAVVEPRRRLARQ